MGSIFIYSFKKWFVFTMTDPYVHRGVAWWHGHVVTRAGQGWPLKPALVPTLLSGANVMATCVHTHNVLRQMLLEGRRVVLLDNYKFC